MKPECGKCRYFQPHEDRNSLGDGHCQIRAPIAPPEGDDDVLGLWPIVYSNDWCGEFEPPAEGAGL